MASWSIDFVRAYGAVLPLGSLWRYRQALVRERKGGHGYSELLTVYLKHPHRWPITLRPASNDHYTFREIFIEGVYNAVARHIPPGGVVLDIGANIGLATVFFARIWPGMRVVCVEPDSQNADLLATNIAPLVKAGRGVVCRGAVWGHSGRVCLERLEKGHVNQRACREPGVADEGSEVVSAYTIGGLMEQHGLAHIDLLKLDVEGAETSVLAGDTSWLDRTGAIAIEFHGDSRTASHFDELMASHGFAIVDDGPHTVVAAKR